MRSLSLLDSHQVDGFRFIKSNPSNFIMWDMGLGKTPTTLLAYADLLDYGYINKVLIISHPTIIASVWYNEAIAWDGLEHLTFNIAIGTPKQRLEILQDDSDFDLISVNNLGWLIDNIDISIYDGLIIDESSLFKSHTSKRFKHIKAFLSGTKLKYKTLLSGTPISNNHQNLFSQMFILDGGKALGKNITDFRRKFMIQGFMKYDWMFHKGAEKEIERLIKPYCLNSDVVLELPKVFYKTIDVVLTADTKNRIDFFRKNGLITDDSKQHNRLIELFKQYNKLDDYEEIWKYQDEFESLLSNMDVVENVISIYSKMLTLASGFYYQVISIKQLHTAIIDALKDFIELYDERYIIVYNFIEEREQISKAIPGATTYDKRNINTIIYDAKDKKIKYLLVHAKNLSHGINGLQYGFNNIIWYSPTTSLETYLQMNKRINRRGQTKNVNIIKFISTNDEKLVYNALEEKNMNQNALLKAMMIHISKGL